MTEVTKKKKRRLFAGRRIKLPLVIYILLLIISAVIVSNYGGAFSYVLFFAVLLYIPVSLACILTSYITLMIYQDLDTRLLYKNKTEKYKLIMENVGFLPTGGIRFFHDDSTAFKEEFVSETFWLMPGSKKEIDNEILCKYAGNYEAGILSVELRDVFGIFKFKYNIKSVLRVSVLPTVTSVAYEEISRILSTGIYQKSVFQLDRLEDFPGNDTRKYAPGDPLNSVHWKNYARSGKLLVRLPERTDSDMVSLVLLPYGNDEKEQKRIKRDYFLEILVSVAWYFAEQKKPLMIYYYNSGVKTFLVDGPESFQRLYIEELGRLYSELTPKMQEDLMGEASGRSVSILLKEEDGSLCLM